MMIGYQSPAVQLVKKLAEKVKGLKLCDTHRSLYATGAEVPLP